MEHSLSLVTQALKEMMSRPDSIPVSPENLSLEWLADELDDSLDWRGRVPKNFQVLPLSLGRSGSVYRVRFDSPPEDSPHSVVIKFCGVEPDAEREWRFFQDLSAAISTTVPTCYASAYEPNSQRAYFLFADLVALGFEEASALDGERMATAIDALVQVQGNCLQSRLESCAWLPEWSADWEESRSRVADRAARFCQNFSGRIEPELLEVTRQIAQSYEGLLQSLRSCHIELVHGDLHCGNIFFASTNRQAKFIDWQTCSRGPRAFDLARLLTEDLPVMMSRSRRDEWLSRYCQRFLSDFGRLIDPRELCREVGDCLSLTWLRLISSDLLLDWESQSAANQKSIRQDLDRVGKALRLYRT